MNLIKHTGLVCLVSFMKEEVVKMEKTIDGTVYTITRVNGTNRFYEGEVILLQEKDNQTFRLRMS